MPIPYRFTNVGLIFDDQEVTLFDAKAKVRNYVKKYRVEVNDKNVSPETCCYAPGMPLPYASYLNEQTGFFDANALCVRISAKRESELSSIVTCEFSTDINSGGPSDTRFPGANGGPGGNAGGNQDNPELEPPEIEYDYEEATIHMMRDLDGRPFLFSSWEVINPTPGINVHRTVVSFSRNELFFSPEKAAQFAGAVNNRPFNTYPMDTVLCMAPRARLMWKGNLSYWRVTYKIKFGYYAGIETNPDTGEQIDLYESFQHSELDRGFVERILKDPPDVVSPYAFVPIKRGETLAKHPVLLNGNGRIQNDISDYTVIQVREGADPETVSVPDPVFLKFKTRKRIDFNTLFTNGVGPGGRPRP